MPRGPGSAHAKATDMTRPLTSNEHASVKDLFCFLPSRLFERRRTSAHEPSTSHNTKKILYGPMLIRCQWSKHVGSFPRHRGVYPRSGYIEDLLGPEVYFVTAIGLTSGLTPAPEWTQAELSPLSPPAGRLSEVGFSVLSGRHITPLISPTAVTKYAPCPSSTWT